MEYKNLIAELESIGELVAKTYKDKLKAGNSIATGKLYNSVDYSVEYTGESLLVKFLAEDYYIYVEEGRAAGKFPPIEVIQKWIIAKGIPDKPGLAFLISRKIATEGIKPKPYLRDITSNLTNFTGRLESAIKQDIIEIIKNNLKDGNNNKII